MSHICPNGHKSQFRSCGICRAERINIRSAKQVTQDARDRAAYANRCRVQQVNARKGHPLDTISKGYRVEIRKDSVTLISLKDGTMPDPFPTVAAAYAWVDR